jgi:phage terminase large subunit-like protein
MARSPKKTTTPTRHTSDDPVTRWAEQVVEGRIIQGPHVRNTCRRHLDDLSNGHRRGLKWDLDAAMRMINFCRDVLRLKGGQFQGIPFDPHPSQQFFFGSIFGWKKADGNRRFRRAFKETAKGNGKSPEAAAIGMYGLLADKESAAEIYAAGKDKDQANILFRDAVAMREQSPALAQRITTSGVNPVWQMSVLSGPQSGSFFKPISREGAHSGPRPHFALCDEVHEHPDGNVIEMLERGFKARRQPLLLMITNSGSDRNSVCYEEHLHAIRVAAGTRDPDHQFTYVGEPIDDTSFSFVCSLDPDDDPLEDPSCWVKANPLLGTILTEEYLAGVVAQAKAIPGKLNNILRLHFCVWTDADKAWMSRATFEPCLADFDPWQESGRKIYAGVDLSATQDLTAVAWVAKTGDIEVTRQKPDGQIETVHEPTFDAWVDAWTPEDTLSERALRDKAPYDVWAKAGHLIPIPGKQIKLNFIAARIAEIAAEHEIGWLAYDRYAYRRLAEELDDLNVDVSQAGHPQGGRKRDKAPDQIVKSFEAAGREAPLGLWMPGSLAMLETLILEKRIRIRRSPVIVSAAMSAAIEEDPFANRWFSKRKATNRIDAIVALAMAVGVATANWDLTETGGSGLDIYFLD